MKTFDEFMSKMLFNEGLFYSLVDRNNDVRNGIEYGYNEALKQAEAEIAMLNKMVFDLQNSAIEMAGKLKQMEGNSQIIDEVTILDEHKFTQEKLQKFAEDITYDRIENNLIEECSFVTVLYKITETPVGKKYDYLAIRTQL